MDKLSHQQEHQQDYQGFRLNEFSLFNWGTFDQKIWKMSPEQENSLLTGNIGSGKSTLVDGLTTLLVPTRKLSFNKAAGAKEKERSLESYFHGFYTSQQDEYGKARAIGLRSNKHYSVIIARFYSQAMDETVSLAQVFWLKPGESKVKRLFAVARTELSIQHHFSGFGSQINQLKKQLRKLNEVELFDTFPPYSQAFSKLLGLGADGKALELFNQTISMKSVGSVTDFVRQNMLEKPDTETQLQELERNYDDLKRLHDAVVAARKKVELLTPVSIFGDEALQADNERIHTDSCRNIIDQYMARTTVELFQTRLIRRRLELDRIKISLTKLEQDKQEKVQAILQLNEEILQNGGGRLQQLEIDIERKSKDREDSRKLYKNYQHLVTTLSLPDQLEPDLFLQNLQQAKSIVEQQLEQLEQLEAHLFEEKTQQRGKTAESKNIQAQLEALKKRKSNIHLRQLTIRQQLCEQLNVDEAQLPFVGELLQVKGKASLWQGAIERVLHNFALSLIVPDELYQQVSQFVEQTHLGTRLVYYRVKEVNSYLTHTPHKDSLLNKIDIKSDTPFYEWVHRELQQRFDYLCCEDLNDFRRSEKALTPRGQIKSGKFRHEKDDRHNIQDKSRYVLGWTNKEKIELLSQQLIHILQQQKNHQNTIDTLEQQKKNDDNKRFNAQNLADFNFSFEQINYPVYIEQIEQLDNEKRQLEQSSNVLKDLKKRLIEHKQSLSEIDAKLKEKYGSQGAKENEISADEEALSEARQQFNTLSEQEITLFFPTLDEMSQRYFADKSLEIRGLNQRTSDLKKKLNDKVQHLEEKRRKKENKMIDAMGNFAHQFPNDVVELDKSPQSLPEYKQMLSRLTEEDLPRHEARFKDMLNRDTIRAMALFRSHLDKQEEDIDARIHLINNALHGLDYQPGTYIEIDRIASPDVDVRDFKQRLKQCVEYTADENLYSEEKFIRVKDLIEQMRNEPKWTQKVVDVRYWHLFNVIERYREDQSEKECYSDSGGKSGGQKEKLAYSILAAAILLQYGLVDKHKQKSHSGTLKKKRRFNLVVIDEAFGRGSKDSTRFGLELFKKLGLQLLLVTPLQKLDIIEHYVKHVHFVDQKNNRSMLLNMTIDEYRERLQTHQNLQKHQAMITLEDDE
ncbi:MAG: hypothetical protein KAI22_04275 [Gammaproteobacteria bacterium]|nr:hypothetical protein [Gammaproteobacteria bacterium]